MNIKKLLALLLAVSIILTARPFDIFIDIFAGLSPYLPIYGKGTYSDPADYRQIHPEIFERKGAVAPAAKFSVVNKANGSVIGTSADDTLTIVEDIPVGTVIKITNLSTKGSGTAIDMVDFQVTRDQSQISSILAAPTSLNSYELALNTPGTYKFYLCVRDNTAKSKTDNWGNWSYNGAHVATGLNYGFNDIKETTGAPETAGGDDFWGLWYFAQVVVKVTKNPPLPDFTISYKGVDVTDNNTDPAAIDISDKSIMLVDHSQPFSSAEPITGRKWYYWDVGSGWTEIAGSANKLTVTIPDMDTTLTGSGINKAIKLVCISSTGGETYKDHTAYFLKALPPPTPGTADIFVYYRDILTGVDVYPSDETSYRGIPYGTYTIIAKPDKESHVLDTATTPSPQTVTVDELNNSKSITFLYLPKEMPPANEPPVAIVRGPEQMMAGETITFYGNDSYDPDGTIANYSWGYPGANYISTSTKGDRLMVWYPYVRNNTRHENVTLTVTDDTGNTDSDDHSIEILPPVPTAALTITGKYKENRKVTLDASASYSPSRYPINNYLWSITNAANVKSAAALNGNSINNVIYKAAGTYNNTVTTPNTTGLSDSESKSVTIIQDQNPIPNFAVTTKLLRNPTDSNQALNTLSNLTASPDGDPIKKTVMFYAYDSDNDGNFEEEVWRYSTNGTTWNNVGLPYSQIRTNFSIYSIAGGNPLNFTIKTNQVGKYKFEAMAIEDILAADTIPALLTPSDYRRGDTFTSKPDTQKIVDVINTAPTVTFEVKKKKEVDILIATDYTGQKLADLQAALNVQKANLLAKNIDVRYTIVNSASTVASIADAQYRYRRYARYMYTGDYEWWSSGGDGDTDHDKGMSDTLVWEEKQALESEAPYLPARTPTNITWNKSGSIFEEDEVGTKSWEKTYYNVTVRAQNDIKSIGTIEVDTYYRGGMSTGSSYGHKTTNIHNDSVSIDIGWQKEEKLTDVAVKVNSVNFASVTSAPLRTDSDRFILFIGDEKSKLFSGAWGTYFPFGGLTKTEHDYLKANNIKPYIVTPAGSLDADLGPEKASEAYPSDSFTYFKALDNSMMILFNEGYPFNVGFGSEIKGVYGDYLLLQDNTLKYRVNGASYITLATGVTKVIQEKDGSGEAINGGNLWIVTSDGMLRQYKNGSAGYVYNYPDADNVFDGSAIMEGTGTYFISTASATHFVFKGGSVKTLYGAGLVGYLAGDARDDGDVQDYTALLVHKNGYVQVGVIWRDSSWSQIEDRYVYYLRDISVVPLSQATYNEDNDISGMSGLPLIKPVSATKWILGGRLYDIPNGSIYYAYYRSRAYYFLPSLTAYPDSYKAIPSVSSVVAGVRYYTNGTIGIPCSWTWKYFTGRYWRYETKTSYVDVPALRSKTIKKVVTALGATAVLTSDNQLFKWTDSASYTSDPAISLSLVTSNAGGAYSNTYDIYSTEVWRIVSSTHNYYWDKGDNTLRKMDDSSVIYSNVVDVKLSQSRGNIYVVTSDGKLYGQGYFGSTAYYGGSQYQVGDTFHDLIKTKIVISDTNKQYITLRDIAASINTTKYFTAGQYQQALNDITNSYLNDTSYTTNYILVNDRVGYNVIYNDYENDGKYTENWTHNHEPYYFENTMGLASFHGQTLTTPVTRFDKKGRYTINVKARDNPKDNNLFDSYRLWSTGNQNVILYVHEKPVALARVTISANANGTYTVRAYDAGSYDRDHTSRADKGIAAREWRWKESSEIAWHNEQMNKTDCKADKTYIVQLRVKDLEGAWSDYYTIEIDRDNPPVALFSVDKPIINISERLRVKDMSYPQSLSSITNWHWVVKKLNADGSVPTANIQSNIYSSSNNGTGAMAGYDANVKTDYSNSGIGRYRIYLRVKNSDGLWSDGGTDAAPDLNSFYSQDIEVDRPPAASFIIEKNPIYIDEQLKLRDRSTAAGTSPLAQWHWIVKRLNPDGTVSPSSLQDAKFNNRNDGAGSMAGCDVNVKTLYADSGAGTYRIYLRVMNGNGIWSDGGTDSTVNLSGCFYRDFIVQESFKISGFRVVRIRDLHLESYYYDSSTGEYFERPIYVNSMAIDYLNFGGLVDGLTKGYIFEFEIDTVNFNDAADAIRITPHFYTCDNFLRDPEERELYWENSLHEILKAGEGGHSAWASVELTSGNRTFTGSNSATWKGSYLIPGTAWAVPSGTPAANAKASRINRDIIVAYEIKGYRGGVMKYDYNLRQWPVERTTAKHPYEIGDVIRYSHTKSNLEDIKVIINRP